MRKGVDEGTEPHRDSHSGKEAVAQFVHNVVSVWRKPRRGSWAGRQEQDGALNPITLEERICYNLNVYVLPQIHVLKS